VRAGNGVPTPTSAPLHDPCYTRNHTAFVQTPFRHPRLITAVLGMFDYVFPENGLMAYKQGQLIGSTVRVHAALCRSRRP
jgi:hypothetical protein